MICITWVHVESAFPYWTNDHFVRRLLWRTFSREKRRRPLHKLFITVDHFGSGGRRSDSRLGRRGKKLAESRKVGKWESRKVAKSRFLKFPDFSCFSLFEKWPKFHFSKAPPFDFSTNSRNQAAAAQILGWGAGGKNSRNLGI